MRFCMHVSVDFGLLACLLCVCVASYRIWASRSTDGRQRRRQVALAYSRAEMLQRLTCNTYGTCCADSESLHARTMILSPLPRPHRAHARSEVRRRAVGCTTSSAVAWRRGWVLEGDQVTVRAHTWQCRHSFDRILRIAVCRCAELPYSCDPPRVPEVNSQPPRASVLQCTIWGGGGALPSADTRPTCACLDGSDGLYSGT